MADIQQHSFITSRHAHYSTLGQAGAEVTDWWIVCHGYGQLARRFIKDFLPIYDEKTFVLAPEGLSRFYWGGFDGPVVSSWMTREDRLEEIDDFVNYLQSLYDHFRPQLPADVRIHLFGFSQGTATIMRWVQARRPAANRILLWAGGVPEDINYQPIDAYWQNLEVQFIYGDSDPFLTEKRVTFQQKNIQEKGLPIAIHTFSGKHEIPADVLVGYKS